VVSPTAAGGVPFNRTINAGSALIYGIDFDVSYLPPQIEDLSLRAGLEWNHGRYKSLHNVPCWGGQSLPEGCTEGLNPSTGRYTGQNLSGQQLVRAPDWQVSFGFDYDVPLGAAAGNWASPTATRSPPAIRGILACAATSDSLVLQDGPWSDLEGAEVAVGPLADRQEHHQQADRFQLQHGERPGCCGARQQNTGTITTLPRGAPVLTNCCVTWIAAARSGCV